ncbi:hypothetical protein [Desulfotruncus alcoholivorax]|nr:hypothetical protein [Desulfotruncus alcoholivorax]
MMCFDSAAVAVVSVDNVKRYPSIVVNLEGCPQCGTVHQPVYGYV